MLAAFSVGILLSTVGFLAFRAIAKKLSEVEAEVRALQDRLQVAHDLLELTHQSVLTLTPEGACR